MFDVVIMGSGPAGLAAAAALSRNTKAVLIDSGLDSFSRVHTNADHLGVGVGGAGLFSDGKFSYFPAGTAVYKLANRSNLKAAHKWVEKKMGKQGIETLPFEEIDFSRKVNETDFIEKNYPSYYASLEQRRNLILDIADVSERVMIITNTSVIGIERLHGGYRLEIKSKSKNASEYIDTKHLIIASGRFGSREIKKIVKPGLELPFRYLRTEFGVRIEASSDIGFLSRKKSPDVKFIWKTKVGEVRTFCTCRNGEIWHIPYQKGYAALSGRSDGPKSEFSNFGLLVRIESDPVQGNQTIETILNSKPLRESTAIVQSLQDFLGAENSNRKEKTEDVIQKRPWFPKNRFRKGCIRTLLGPQAYELLKGAIENLLTVSPDLNHNEVMMVFPSIEGIGEYIETDRNLKVTDEKIWVAGDANGTFRGIIPAFLSGYYAGVEAKKSLRQSTPIHIAPSESRVTDEVIV